ncbi:alpha/beta hydrolase [Mycetocola saprophilus]|uniref:alpha/beta hydrolase n=1 Tax=Mycetocola saprophilus TaxID=76636 RepID=UPI00068E2E22|nr:alpha/beta-hydrolase family protein [Mycetocola saprophilus]
MHHATPDERPARSPQPETTEPADDQNFVQSPVRVGTTLRTAGPWWRLNVAGVIFGLIPAYLSLTPSLLPRPAILQGVMTAVIFLLGYAFGRLLWAIGRRVLPWRVSARVRRNVWISVLVVTAMGLSGLGAAALAWQNEVRELVEMPPGGAPHAGLFVLGLLPVTLLGLAIGRGFSTLYRRSRARRGTPVALGISVLVGIVAAAVIVSGAMFGVDRIYAASNAEPAEGLHAPTSAERSGGPGSEIPWDTLGRHGAAFVSEGPDAQQIRDITGRPAMEPIRVYAGLKSAPTTRERAALAVRELERTHAFDRDVLVVATSTGSGWLEPQTVDAVEYLHGGNTAIVSMQYAYTPSWVSFVFDPDAPVAAARDLFDAVSAAIHALPEGAHRPKLISYGLSLGAQGAQAVFTSLADVRARTDGALFVGSPNGTPLWQKLQSMRDPGSPEWQPVLDEGREVRWMARSGDLDLLPGAWEYPRVAYLQHASDPVTWLGPDLLWQEPDWLTPGQRSDQISPDMRWIPVVTAAQVLIDMLMGESVPARHGHNYGDLIVESWRAVTGSSVTDPAALARIQDTIMQMASIQPFGG